MATAVPYAEFLRGRDPIEVLADTPKRLNELAHKIGAEGLDRSWAPGKWSGREILCHLADCELAFGFRWRQVVADPKVVMQPFDQDAWAKAYGPLETKWALGMFSSARLWNLEWLKTVPEEAFSIPGVHPERGALTLRDLITITAGHDMNHTRQIETLAAV
jgi:DinB superfamily